MVFTSILRGGYIEGSKFLDRIVNEAVTQKNIKIGNNLKVFIYLRDKYNLEFYTEESEETLNEGFIDFTNWYVKCSGNMYYVDLLFDKVYKKENKNSIKREISLPKNVFFVIIKNVEDLLNVEEKEFFKAMNSL